MEDDFPKELREILQDPEKFWHLAMEFAIQFGEPGDNKKFGEFFRYSLETVIKQNADYVFSLSESPIETIFLNSLILVFIKSDSPGLAVHRTFNDTEKELKKFRALFAHFKSFLAWCEERSLDFTQIIEFLDNGLKAEKMDQSEREYFDLLLSRYYLLPLEDSFHMTLQPEFPNMEIDGKSIRPDIYFWIPTKPNINILVECDGFDYHSDKGEFSSDRKQDSALQQRGYEILRYSATEIAKNPASASFDLFQRLSNFLEEES